MAKNQKSKNFKNILDGEFKGKPKPKPTITKPPIGTTEEKPIDFGNNPITKFDKNKIKCEKYVPVKDKYYSEKGYNCILEEDEVEPETDEW